jgi:hypothetical protein
MFNFTNPHVAGILPDLLSPLDPRSAAEQLQETYAHGGGWSPFARFALHDWQQPGQATLAYPEDPPMREISRAKLRDETLILFECEWLAIVQPDGRFEVSRVD